MNIVEVNQYSEHALEALNHFLPQLSSSSLPISEADFNKIIQSEASHLLMAEDEGRYYGSLTLVTFKIPTGIRAWVEDVVVKKEARGKGVGQALVEHAIFLANELGVKTVDLTSSPSREAANALYKRVGFELRETNVYRYKNT